jgi:hypothetical protein
MQLTNAFANWFFFGLNGIGGWYLFFLAALGTTAWVFYNSSKRRLPAAGWRIALVLVIMLVLPAIIFHFTFNPANPDISPLKPYIEPIFYLGILGGILPLVLAIGYFVTYQGLEADSSGFLFEKNRVANRQPKSPKTVKVFLCHASEDKPAIRQLHEKLLREGFYVWLDEKSLLPGQDWKQEISKAVRNSDIVVICLSKMSINKAGFVQKEIRYALDVADEKPENQIFLIPVRLEECHVPERLKDKQWVDLFAETGFDRLVAAISTRKEFPTYLDERNEFLKRK